MKKAVLVLSVVALGLFAGSCSKNHTSDLDKPTIENPIAVDPGFDVPGKTPR